MIDITMQKLDIKGGIVLNDVISREACKISDKSFAHGFRDKRVVMFAGNRERATFIDNLADMIWSRIRVYRTLHYDSRHEDYHSTCNLQPCTGTYKAVGINPFMRVSNTIQVRASGGIPTQCTVLAKIIWVFRRVTSNDDFDGGETSFRSYKSGEEDPIIQSIVPKTGSVLYSITRKNTKVLLETVGMVLRTEVMFTKILREPRSVSCRCLEIDLLVNI
jgi:hypothetical protein